MQTHPEKTQAAPRVRAALAVVLLALVASVLAPPAGAAPIRVSGRAAAAPPATLSDYWNGRADWKLAHFYDKEAYELLPGDGGFGAGTLFDIGPDGSWYWFYRTIVNPGANCSFFPSTGTVVRKSSDRGHTWGPAVRVVEPQAGTAWACEATDGDAHWDGSQWYYLFQCRADPAHPGPWGDVWNVCVFRNTAADPTTGRWEPVVDHPVMGDYPGGYNPWLDICDQASDDCARVAGGTRRVDGTGTPSIFDVPSEPGWHFVDLHGVDPQGLQYQGIVKTRDFLTYVAGTGSNLPTDAVFDRGDAVAWREPTPFWGPAQIGGGGGAIAYDPTDGYYYNVVEASNGPGGCFLASTMDLGILRAKSPAATSWEQPSRPGRENPIFYSQQDTLSEEPHALRCTPSYSTVFRDPTTGETFLSFVRRSSDRSQGVYVFKLLFNLLANGDAWRCVDSAPWRLASPSSPTDAFAIWRDGNWASDGGCYFALTRDVGQDVRVAPGSVSSVAWGGKLAGRSSSAAPPMGYLSLPGSGTAQLTLTQLNRHGRLLSTATLPVAVGAAGEDYVAASSRTSVHRSTSTLRFTISPGGSGLAILADELYVEPLAGRARIPLPGRFSR